MIRDNFERIGEILDFSNPNYFYHVQIIARRKENPDLNKSDKIVKSYCVYSLEYLQSHKEEMIKLAELFNARIYISVNHKDKEKVFKQILSNLVIQNVSDNFEFHNAIESAIGKNFVSSSKRFLVDIDVRDGHIVDDVIKRINSTVYPPTEEERVIATIPTINGYHVICKPCRIGDLDGLYPSGVVSYQSNGLTLLYYSDNKGCKVVLD